jgi:hypothetical protein
MGVVSDGSLRNQPHTPEGCSNTIRVVDTTIPDSRVAVDVIYFNVSEGSALLLFDGTDTDKAPLVRITAADVGKRFYATGTTMTVRWQAAQNPAGALGWQLNWIEGRI